MGNVHGWLFMYLVSKRFAESVRVRIQAMYAIWLLTLVFFTGFVTIYYLQHEPYTLELLTLVMVSAVTAFYVARILLYGARINDRGYATALRLHSVVVRPATTTHALPHVVRTTHTPLPSRYQHRLQ